MTEVGPERRIALVEYIAHLSVQDWQGVARDLVALGFAPKGARRLPALDHRSTGGVVAAGMAFWVAACYLRQMAHSLAEAILA